MRDTYLPFHQPSLDNREILAVSDVLESGWITTGPRVSEFESLFSDFIGSQYSVALNSGTAALHLSLASLGISKGSEVVLPSMTFTASAETLIHLGAKPVLADCRRDTFNLDEVVIERLITPNTKAIMPVHMAGQPCEMHYISQLAKLKNIPIVEDAAHALPSKYKDKMVGTIGDLTCFSFYATKTLTTGEGGMVSTDSEELANRIRMLSLHGISKDAWNRYSEQGTWRYEVHAPGYKYNMTDIAAAMGTVQL